jgi:Ca2+/Na+ antiporter
MGSFCRIAGIFVWVLSGFITVSFFFLYSLFWLGEPRHPQAYGLKAPPEENTPSIYRGEIGTYELFFLGFLVFGFCKYLINKERKILRLF